VQVQCAEAVQCNVPRREAAKAERAAKGVLL
jgi:hypothetical protein